MKKKIGLLIAASALAVCSAFALVGCGGGSDAHVLVKVNAKEATCVSAGNIEYYKCYAPDCGKLFSDPEGENEVTLESVTINPKGHTLTGIGEAIEPTCTEDGITVGEKCSTCGTLVTGQQVITKKGHSAIKVDGTDATCESDGTITYYACSACHQNFIDDKCEIVVQSVTVKATGHSYSEWTYSGESKHTKVCENDPTHSETVDCRYGKISDFTDGTGHYLTCIICDGQTNKLPHDLKYVVTDDGEGHWAECKSCAYVSETEAHAPALLSVKITGSKLYGGRTITVNDIAVTSVCSCGTKQVLEAEDLTFEDTLLVDGKNTLSVTYGDFTQEFEYDAPVEPTFALTIDGATFDGGAKTLNLKEGEKCTAEIALTEGKTFLGYRDGLEVLEDLSDFTMPGNAYTIYALYEEDLIHFAPANRAQSNFSSETYDHVILENGIIATRFIWDDDEATHLPMKYPHSGADTGTHKVNVYSPAHKSSLMFIYVVNNGEKDAQLIYQAENYGVKGEIHFTAKAGETTRVPFIYSNEEASYTTFSTCDHRISLEEGSRAAGETVELDIYGKLVSTENNKLQYITASMSTFDTFLEEGDTIDLSKITVTANISGYNINIYDYTCNIEEGTQWTPDITEIEVSYLGFTSTIKLNNYADWIHASVPANPNVTSWISAEHITDEATGLPSTKITFKAGATNGSDTYTDPTNDKGIGLDYNTSMPQYVGSTRYIFVYVKNTSNQAIKARLYWENWGDIGGANIDVEPGATAQYPVSITASGSYGTTTGCRINIKLLCDIGDEDATIEVYTLYKAFSNEVNSISVDSASTHTTTFTVGETFNTNNLRLAISTSLGSEVNVRIVNYTTDLDGYEFTADDIGEKTVTVTWNGLTTTYKINVVAAE